FSSRRRHTRCLSDWSSDVCSSDLRGHLWSAFRSAGDSDESKRPVFHGSDYGHRGRRGERDFAGDICGGISPGRKYLHFCCDSWARTRMRPILMTSMAMIAGMVPMALGIGEGSQQTAPLGRAVIGGLLFATAATLLILPLVFSLVQERAGVKSPSLDPDDPASAFARSSNPVPGGAA